MTHRTLKNLGRLIGHRGVAGLAPENTLESFALAHHYGLQSVEFDVTLSADGVAFVIHDDSLERTTNGRGKVAMASADYLKSLDAGSWFSDEYHHSRIPTLRETLRWLRQHKMTANIEIKPSPGRIHDTVQVVLSELDELWPSNRALPLISSFEPDVLRLCRTLEPKIPIGFLLHTWQPAEIDFAQSLNCLSINLHYLIASASRIQALHQQGFAVYSYTVNLQFLISKLFAAGIDGVFSDYPAWRLPR